MTESEPNLESEVLAAWVELQGRTPCRKCRSTAWALLPARRWTQGGARVGIYLVLGSPAERVAVISFSCEGCQAEIERPAYSREQLSQQPFPAVTLEGQESPSIAPNVTLTSREDDEPDAPGGD